MIDFYECMKDTYYYIGRVIQFAIHYLFMAIMLLLPLSLYSIQQSPVFRSVTVSEGLSHNTINAIYKDTRGFVWLGTQMGLDRFDGVNVTTYPQFSGRTVFSAFRLLFRRKDLSLRDLTHTLAYCGVTIHQSEIQVA